MKIGYHLCGALLDKESIILPGSYGHIITNVYGKDPDFSLGDPIALYYEEKLEEHRRLHAPEKPSRLNCVFICHSLENLKNFKNKSNRQFQFGYQVEILGDIQNAHYADWKLYDRSWTSFKDWKNKLDESILNYWNEDRLNYLNDPFSPLEILLNNKLKIIKRVL